MTSRITTFSHVFGSIVRSSISASLNGIHLPSKYRTAHLATPLAARLLALWHSAHGFVALVLCIYLCGLMSAQSTGTAQASSREQWSAVWITHPTAPLREPVTLHFRRSFQAPAAVTRFVIHVSADNRFILYLNGKRLGDGPARGDLAHWRYETFDLGPLLVPGQNILSATVWNFGVFAPIAQVSDRTAFLVQGDTAAESVVNTGEQWKVEVERGHRVYPRQPKGFWQYMAAGSGESLHAADYDWDWQTEDTSLGEWTSAASAIRESIYPQSGVAASRGAVSDSSWELVPDTLPPMTYQQQDAGHIVRTDLPGSSDFPATPLTISAHSHRHIMLDRSSLTTAYPRLAFSGGRGSQIQLTYSEALYDEKQKKGDRDEVGDRQALGLQDQVFPDGSRSRVFEPLWWRTWRYLDLEITTADEPLTLDGMTAFYTAYPFHPVAHFQSSDPDLDRIWNIGWHTVELDAHETFMDTAYYEQLQYVGDSRIEAMITYAVTNDDRLPRQTIRAIDDSRTSDGLTASRYPASLSQKIPPFSLLWIGMIHDYALYHSDAAFVKDTLPGTRTVLSWFAQYQRPNGLLARLPYWSFVDWTEDNHPLPTYDEKGQSCLVTLQYAGALKEAMDLEHRFGEPSAASGYDRQLLKVKRGILDNCWDPARRLIADSPRKDAFSQQTNALAVLYDVIPKRDQVRVLEDVLSPHNIRRGEASTYITPATYYFTYYVARALVHAGAADRYFDLLNAWRPLLHQHFTAWPEFPKDTRSDSHGWSADPTYDLLAIVAGVRPSTWGFSRVTIAPHLGTLKELDAVVPHESGPIHVHYKADSRSLHANIDLPASLGGTFHWHGRRLSLHGGSNLIHLADLKYRPVQAHNAPR